jgi:hypothetical protein
MPNDNDQNQGAPKGEPLRMRLPGFDATTKLASAMQSSASLTPWVGGPVRPVGAAPPR